VWFVGVFERNQPVLEAVCDGPDKRGQCPLALINNRAPCAGRDLRVSKVRSLPSGRIRRIRARIAVSPLADSCPLSDTTFAYRDLLPIPSLDGKELD